ncbi:hypothetical protein, partial [Arthrobacter sp. 1088]|uniref:hypothetical protein n=1 Tax=Arthrobacter sp. 1088 TaxID=2817768 RepID=UPI00286C259F
MRSSLVMVPLSFAEDSVGGVLVVSRQLPLSPVVLAAGEARGAVPDAGLSTRRARDRKFPEE